MPPPAILDPGALDAAKIIADRQAIEAYNHQRFEFQLLDAVLLFDETTRVFAGYHDVRADAWWARGHIPGRPLFPGVLMIEVAAQLSSYASNRALARTGFLGFVGVDGVKFRGAVEPPARFLVVGRATMLKPRRTVCVTQGFVGDAMVFEAEITGMPI